MMDVETAKSEPAQNEASNGQQAKPEDVTTPPKPEDVTTPPKPDDVPNAPKSEDVPNAPTPAPGADGGKKEEKAPGYALSDKPGKKSRHGSTRSRPDESVVLERGVKGTIKWYNSLREFGFIMRQDTGEDVFVHKTHILTMRSWVLPCPRKDDEVEFDVLKGSGGRYEAAAVSGPNGTLVRGRPAPRGRRQVASMKPANAQPLVQANSGVSAMDRDGPRMAPASDKRRRAASDEMITQGADTKPEKKRRAPLRRQFRRKNKKAQNEDGGGSKPENDATAKTEKDAPSKNENGAPVKAEKEEAPKTVSKPSKQKPSENGDAKPSENGTQHAAVTA